MKRGFTATVTCLIGASMLTCGQAQAQQDESRERELEDLIQRLSRRIDHLERRLDTQETAEAAQFAPKAVESRVANLEMSLQEMKDTGAVAGDNDFRVYWDDGLRFKTMDGSFKLKIGGRIQYDAAFFDEDDDIETAIGSDIEDDSEFRRARIYISGNIWDNVEFKAEYDFEDGDSDFKDVYMGLLNVPIVRNIRIGHFKEPFSLEEQTSTNDITFMERGLPNVFSPGRNTGAMFWGNEMDQRMSWAVGFFRESDDYGEGIDGRSYNATGRVTFLPWYEEDGRKLLHLGLGYTFKNIDDDDLIRYRARPEANLSPRVVDTGLFEADYVQTVGVELAWVSGPFSLQSEYIHNFVESDTTSDPGFCSTYVQASYFLTGEHRPYHRVGAKFGRVIPNENVGPDGGWGAWEIAGRYSYLDLNDGPVTGGRLNDFTLGVNWYLNPNMRVMWNYIYADSEDAGVVNVYQWRFQIAF